MKLLERVCCMQLRTGTIVVAVFGILGALLNIMISVGALNRSEEYLAKLGPEYRDAVKGAQIQHIVSIVLSVVSLITSSLLILGAVKKNRFCLLPWLIQSGIGLALACIGFPILLIALIIASTPFGYVFFTFLICGLVLALSIYLFMGVYSYYINLQGNQRQNGQGFEFLNGDRSRSKV